MSHLDRWLLHGSLRVIKLQPRFKVCNISYTCMHVLFHSSFLLLTFWYINLKKIKGKECIHVTSMILLWHPFTLKINTLSNYAHPLVMEQGGERGGWYCFLPICPSVKKVWTIVLLNGYFHIKPVLCLRQSYWVEVSCIGPRQCPV